MQSHIASIVLNKESDLFEKTDRMVRKSVIVYVQK